MPSHVSFEIGINIRQVRLEFVAGCFNRAQLFFSSVESGKPCRTWLKGLPYFHHGAEWKLPPTNQHLDRTRHDRGHGSTNRCASVSALARAYQLLRFEKAQRLPDGCSANSGTFNQLSLGRELVAFPQFIAENLLSQHVRQDVALSGRLDRRDIEYVRFLVHVSLPSRLGVACSCLLVYRNGLTIRLTNHSKQVNITSNEPPGVVCRKRRKQAGCGYTRSQKPLGGTLSFNPQRSRSNRGPSARYWVRAAPERRLCFVSLRASRRRRPVASSSADAMSRMCRRKSGTSGSCFKTMPSFRT